MQPECRQHPTAQPEGLSKDYSARYSRGMLSLSNYGPYKPCNPWHLSAGLVMYGNAVTLLLFTMMLHKYCTAMRRVEVHVYTRHVAFHTSCLSEVCKEWLQSGSWFDLAGIWRLGHKVSLAPTLWLRWVCHCLPSRYRYQTTLHRSAASVNFILENDV